MVTPTNLSIWLREQAWPMAIILAALLLTYIALRLSAKKRRDALVRSREGVTAESFAAYLAQFGFDPVIAEATFRYLQTVQKIRFPILPADSLDEDLGLGLEEVHQTRIDLAAALRRQYNPGIAHAPLLTVEDLIRFLQASPRVVAPRTSVA